MGNEGTYRDILDVLDVVVESASVDYGCFLIIACQDLWKKKDEAQVQFGRVWLIRLNFTRIFVF